MLKDIGPDKPYILQMDVSELGLGVVFSQFEDNEEEHPVAFASRKCLLRQSLRKSV